MNFELILFIALAVTGLIWLGDRVLFERKRGRHGKEPVLTEYARGFFPVILAVFLLRSFLVEPFRIPSGSMMPTLLVGDFILVNKYTYGIRLPVIHKKILVLNNPQHGDVMVFRYPQDPSLDYIKRVIGLPGDLVEYRNKKLTINGKPLEYQTDGTYSYVKAGLNYVTASLYQEKLGDRLHLEMVEPDAPPVLQGQIMPFAHQEDCSYDEAGFSCRVPAGEYFMMGDNRDGSNDSRYWGFVPDENIVGKAFFIWLNLDDLKRIGTRIH
jgi:signal peptidase I